MTARALKNSTTYKGNASKASISWRVDRHSREALWSSETMQSKISLLIRCHGCCQVSDRWMVQVNFKSKIATSRLYEVILEEVGGVQATSSSASVIGVWVMMLIQTYIFLRLVWTWFAQYWKTCYYLIVLCGIQDVTTCWRPRWPQQQEPTLPPVERSWISDLLSLILIFFFCDFLT